jgi:hypothetical protein
MLMIASGFRLSGVMRLFSRHLSFDRLCELTNLSEFNCSRPTLLSSGRSRSSQGSGHLPQARTISIDDEWAFFLRRRVDTGGFPFVVSGTDSGDDKIDSHNRQIESRRIRFWLVGC